VACSNDTPSIATFSGSVLLQYRCAEVPGLVLMIDSALSFVSELESRFNSESSAKHTEAASFPNFGRLQSSCLYKSFLQRGGRQQTLNRGHFSFLLFIAQFLKLGSFNPRINYIMLFFINSSAIHGLTRYL
jgi:hypothetical protein